ncbi:hypothetical protein HMPREF9501_02539 [Enterococcus faecalis TX0027]|nr:hypothetical protein HMPREF9501_02539 [Enterococcus faecalis TX0027]
MCMQKKKHLPKMHNTSPSRDSAVGVLNMYLYYKKLQLFCKMKT